jgi:hypothetical protein
VAQLSGQNPNSPDTDLTYDDFQTYGDKLEAKVANGNKLSPQERQDLSTLQTLLPNYGTIASHIGDYFDGEYHISKKAMGVNLARESALALLDHKVFDKMAAEYGKPELTGEEISSYVSKHAKELSQRDAEVLRTLGERMQPRDWVAALIGIDDGQTTYITKDSIQKGLTNFGLNAFVVR